MKVLFVGADEVWALEKEYQREFSKYCETDLFNAHGMFLEYYQKGLLNKLFYKVGISGLEGRINKKLLVKAKSFKPDVVWIFKGMEIVPDTLEKLKAEGAILVNYNPDHPFEHFSKGSGNSNIINSIGLYDMHFSYSLSIKERIEASYHLACHWLPFGYFKAISPNKKSVEKVSLCFIGNGDSERKRIIKLLANNEIKVDVYGHFWEDLSSENNISIKPAIYKEDFNSIAQEYRIQLNIFRPHNLGSHNMRTFEMPALGCIMLAPKSEEHLQFFKEGEEAFYYDSDETLVEKCKKILAFDQSKVNQLKKNAYNRSIKSGYSYQKRAEFAFQKMDEILKNRVNKKGGSDAG